MVQKGGIDANYTKFIVKTSDYVGGENNTNFKEYEWPSDEHLHSLAERDLRLLKNYKVTAIRWL